MLHPNISARTEPGAAVAAIFRHHHEVTELLFIQRATAAGDPWSGHMAFPGGRIDPTDTDRFDTAERETREELALDLSPARRLGALGTVEGGRATNRRLVVSGHCYWLDGDRPQLEPNREVAAALWVPVDHLLDPERYIDYHYPSSGPSSVFPGIQLDEPTQVVWGLTLRLLADLFNRLEQPFVIPPH